MENKDLLTLDDITTCIFHKEWLVEGIGRLDPDTQARIMLDALRMGFGMDPLFHEEDPVVGAFSEILSNKVLGQKNAYLDKVNLSKSGAGRKKKFKDEEIHRLCQEGLTVSEIASQLNCSESTIRHSAGYQNIKNTEFVF